MLLVRAMSLGGWEGHSNCETSAAGIGRGKESKRAVTGAGSATRELHFAGSVDEKIRPDELDIERTAWSCRCPPCSPPPSSADVRRHEDTASTRNAVHRVENGFRGAVMEQPPTQPSRGEIPGNDDDIVETGSMLDTRHFADARGDTTPIVDYFELEPMRLDVCPPPAQRVHLDRAGCDVDSSMLCRRKARRRNQAAAVTRRDPAHPRRRSPTVDRLPTIGIVRAGASPRGAS